MGFKSLRLCKFILVAMVISIGTQGWCKPNISEIVSGVIIRSISLFYVVVAVEPDQNRALTVDAAGHGHWFDLTKWDDNYDELFKPEKTNPYSFVLVQQNKPDELERYSVSYFIKGGLFLGDYVVTPQGSIYSVGKRVSRPQGAELVFLISNNIPVPVDTWSYQEAINIYNVSGRDAVNFRRVSIKSKIIDKTNGMMSGFDIASLRQQANTAITRCGGSDGGVME